MAEPRIEVSDKAEADLNAIEDYIVERDSQRRADLALARIQKTMRSLAFMPRMGRRRATFSREARSFACRPWVIIYAPLPDGNGIRVLRVFDGRRDLRALLGDPQNAPKKP